MPRFRITETQLVLITVDLEARTEEEARELFMLSMFDETDVVREVTDSQGLTITEEANEPRA